MNPFPPGEKCVREENQINYLILAERGGFLPPAGEKMGRALGPRPGPGLAQTQRGKKMGGPFLARNLKNQVKWLKFMCKIMLSGYFDPES